MLTFAANETAKVITVNVSGDSILELDETFAVSLYNPTNGATFTSETATRTITNDDGSPRVSVSDAFVSINANQDKAIKFTVTLSKPSDQNVVITYSAFDDTANSTGLGESQDYQSTFNRTLTFAPGETTKEIEIMVFGERGVSDSDLEIFSKDTAYRNWQPGNDVDKIPQINSSLYGDLGYYVDEVFNDSSSGYQGYGLTSDEKFSLSLTSANNATINRGEAIGTIYDLGKTPVLVSRGSTDGKDIFSDLNPDGIGFNQYTRNRVSLENWLRTESQVQNGEVNFSPILTGHSLGGALTQWIASNYVRNLEKVVTFNSPGIKLTDTPKANIENTTHYLTSSDVVSLAGRDYIPGIYILSDYNSFGPLGTVGTHLVPTLNSQVGYDSVDLAKWNQQPDFQSKIPNQSSGNLDDFFFTYLPDPDHFGLQVALAAIGGVALFIPVVGSPIGEQLISLAAALTFRGTTEALRSDIGEAIYNPKDSLFNLVTNAASDAVRAFSSDVRKKIIQSTKDSLNPLANNFTAQSISPANDSEQSLASFSGIENLSLTAVSSTPLSPWESFSKWTVGIWNASPDWDIQTFTNAIENINTPPGVENPILDQVATEDTPFNFTFSEDTFIEIDAGDSLTYTATLADGNPLPTWLNFNPTTRTFSF